VNDFPLVYFCPDTHTHWISKFKDQITEEKRDVDNYVARRRELEILGAELFSPLNAINSLLDPLDIRMGKGKIAFRSTDFLALEVLYYLGFYFSKLNLTTTWLRKFPRFIP